MKPFISFGQFIRQRRQKCKKSLQSLALEIGMDSSYLSKIEREEIGWPRDASLDLLANALLIDVDILSDKLCLTYIRNILIS